MAGLSYALDLAEARPRGRARLRLGALGRAVPRRAHRPPRPPALPRALHRPQRAEDRGDRRLPAARARRVRRACRYRFAPPVARLPPARHRRARRHRARGPSRSRRAAARLGPRPRRRAADRRRRQRPLRRDHRRALPPRRHARAACRSAARFAQTVVSLVRHGLGVAIIDEFSVAGVYMPGLVRVPLADPVEISRLRRAARPTACCRASPSTRSPASRDELADAVAQPALAARTPGYVNIMLR